MSIIDAETREAVDELMAMPLDDVFRLYVRMSESAPETLHAVALAIRDLARAGRIGDDQVPMLVSLLELARDRATLSHLAKALAAFGRKGEPGAAVLVEKLTELKVTDDVDFWVLDGGVWALGFLGGKAAQAFIEKLQKEKKKRVATDGFLYEGEMTVEQRVERWAHTLSEVAALIAGPDPGPWREKKTKLAAKPARKAK